MCLAVPGQVVERFTAGEMPMGRVDFNGVRREVCLACTPEAGVGAWVVVHVGFAISVLDEAEARRSLALLDALGELEAEDDATGASPCPEGAS
jgi:hydrogenase expression/formation protein HypC